MVRGLPSTAWPMLPTSEENVWANHCAWSGLMGMRCVSSSVQRVARAVAAAAAGDGEGSIAAVRLRAVARVAVAVGGEGVGAGQRAPEIPGAGDAGVGSEFGDRNPDEDAAGPVA